MAVHAASTPLISVVVPTHNRPDMLAEALASIRAQTFIDYEIIVISNGESDGMRRASHAAAKAHDCRYFTLRKGNVCVARNFGIEQAKGEWIALLDDDDLWPPNKLARQIEEVTRSNVDLIAADYVECWNDGREVIRRPRPPEGWSYVKAASHMHWWAATGATLVRRKAYQKSGGFDPYQRSAEDGDMWRRISWRHNIQQMDEVLLRYRRGHSSTTMQSEWRRYRYDLRHLAKMYFDTPRDLRSELPSLTTFVRERFPDVPAPTWWLASRRWLFWLSPRTRLVQLRSRIRLRTRWHQFYHWLRWTPHPLLRPRTRLMQLRARAMALVGRS